MSPTTLASQIPNSLVGALVAVGIIMGYITVNGLFLIWMERKVSARFQRRLGPTEVGRFGSLQTLADVGKLLGKQLISPASIDKPLYHIAPGLVFVPEESLCAGKP